MKDRYVVESIVPQGVQPRYLRLEVLTEDALPLRGPGRASDGNFVVSKLSASFVPTSSLAEPTAIKFVSALADFEQTNFPAKSALDDDLKDGWAVSPQVGMAHVAVFEVAPGTMIPAGSMLRITIEQLHSDQHALGKFRLSVTEQLTTSPPMETPQRQDLINARDTLQKELAVPVPLAMAATEGGTPGGLFPGIQDVPIHVRGSYAKLGPIARRRLPRFFAGENQPPITQWSDRRELAAWGASPENPLTARVIVNRVWHWHFGEGLVRTPNNFGLLSEPPSHPELLDWLATRFVEEGWSLKKLHRRILLSATYRQSSRASSEVFDKDPENRLVGRFSPRRLEAEAIRDAILSVGGQLDPAPGGPAGDDFTIRRRSLYVQTARWQRDSYANLFDAANPDSSTEKRVDSTVAPQALLLLNHPWMQEQAKHLAERLIREAPRDDSAVRDMKNPIANLVPSGSIDRQRMKLDALRNLNELAREERARNSQLEARISSFELAFQMQRSAPEAFDLSAETRATHQLYGTDKPESELFGRQCLLARRLVERGVRFVQLFDAPSNNVWDHHGDLRENLPKRCLAVDRPIAALLTDLRSRGLLEDTLVVWGGEFGRTPTAEGNNGREHHPFGFSMWMAGGGVRGGMSHGATDEFGWHSVENKVHVHDLHATILHLMGLDHERLTFRFGGRDYRLTDVHGHVVHEILA